MASRFRFENGYKFDRWIFKTAMFLVFVFLFIIAWKADFKLDYYYCIQGPMPGDSIFPEQLQGPPGYCENPFYKPADWKNEKYLAPGEYGTKPSNLFNNAWQITLTIIIAGFVANHLIHNRGVKIGQKIFDKSENREGSFSSSEAYERGQKDFSQEQIDLEKRRL